jgi:hypothetical protein
MPLYSYKCKTCNKSETKINRIANHESGAPLCCDTQMKQTITPVTMGMVNAESAKVHENYLCQATGNVITNAKEKKYNEDKHGLVLHEAGMGLNKEQRQAKQDESRNFKSHVPKDLQKTFEKECFT